MRRALRDITGYAEAERFAVAARAYCNYISQTEEIDYTELSSLMFAVGHAEATLTWIAEEYDDEPFEDIGLSTDQELALERRLRKLLALDVDAHAAQPDYDPVDKERVGALSIDLAELYGELMNGLMLWDLHQREALLHAMWLWRFQAAHWTEHLSRGLWSIQQLRFKFGWK